MAQEFSRMLCRQSSGRLVLVVGSVGTEAHFPLQNHPHIRLALDPDFIQVYQSVHLRPFFFNESLILSFILH